MIFQVNLENTESVSVNELKNYLIVRFFFENFQMNGLKIDVNWFEIYFQNFIFPYRIVCFVRKFNKTHFYHNF